MTPEAEAAHRERRSAIQEANSAAFDGFREALVDALIGHGTGKVLLADHIAQFAVRDLADHLLREMDDRGIGLVKHDVPGRQP